MLKNNLKYIVLVIILVIALSITAGYINKSPIKPNTTYYFKDYKQYSNNGKNNNVVKGVKTTLLSKVVLAKNINGVGFDTTPIVSGDMEYIGTMNRATLSGALYAIQRTTGKVVWHDNFSNEDMANPVVVPQVGMVFIGTGNSKHYGKSNGISSRAPVIPLRVSFHLILLLFIFTSNTAYGLAPPKYTLLPTITGDDIDTIDPIFKLHRSFPLLAVNA